MKIIKNKDRFPSTHHFVYNDKKYPIKISFFKLSSEYFLENQDEIEQCKDIPLVDENVGKNLNLSEKTIKEFIQYVEQEEIALNQDNIVSLHYLGTKYSVKSLIDDIIEYIEEHQIEFAVENLIIHQNDNIYDTEIYEKIISENLTNYIKTDSIFNINFPILYRILINSKKQKEEEEEKLSFYFKCLNKYGKIASILFKYVDFDKFNPKYLNLLFTKYSEIFDFQFIDSKVIKKLFEENGKLKQTLEHHEEEMRNQSLIIKQKKQDIDELKSSNEIQINQQKQNFELKINKLNKKIGMLQTELEQTKKKNENQSLIIKQKKQEIDELKSDNEFQINKQKQNFEMKINELNKEIKMLQTELEQTKKKNENQRMKYEEENEKLKSEIKILKENEVKLKSQTDSKNIKTFAPIGNVGDDGIIRYLDGIAASKNDQHLINIYKSMYYKFDIYKKLREKDEDIPKFKYTKNDDSLLLLFDFKNFQIEISSYSIKSARYDKDCAHIKSWSIEISNDLKSWETIDEHSNYSGLNGPYIIKTFDVRASHFARYCLLKSSNDFYGKNDGCWALEIDHIEFYGRLKS